MPSHAPDSNPVDSAITGDSDDRIGPSYDTSLDFGDGDELDLNDEVYDDPSPTSHPRTIVGSEPPVAHRILPDDDVESAPSVPDVGGIVDGDEDDAADDDWDRNTPEASGYDSGDEDDSERDAEPDEDDGEPAGMTDANTPKTNQEPVGMTATPSDSKDSEPDGDKTDKPSLIDSIRDRLSGFVVSIKSEVGASSDDEPSKGRELVPADESDEDSDEDKDDSKSGKSKKGGKKGKGRRKLSRRERIMAVVMAVVLVLVGLWVATNVSAASRKSSTSFAPDEGTAIIDDVRYSSGKVSFRAASANGMLGHMRASAVVKAWSPSLAHPTSIVAPRTVMTCAPTDVELPTSGSVGVTMQCSGSKGVWMRPQVRMESR